jgi:hypothetical protein
VRVSVKEQAVRLDGLSSEQIVDIKFAQIAEGDLARGNIA